MDVLQWMLCNQWEQILTFFKLADFLKTAKLTVGNATKGIFHSVPGILGKTAYVRTVEPLYKGHIWTS